MAKQNCKLCGGTGWVVSDRDGISQADRCQCVAETRGAELEERARIPRNYRDASLEDFFLPQDNPIARDELSAAMSIVKGYARNYPLTPKPGLLLAGPPGTGKTHLAVAALHLLIARGHEGLFYDYQNLLEKIRSGYSETLGTSSREAYRSALETEILLLDDLGAHRVTDWVEDTVTSIITYRYNERKPLIATTNLPDADMGGATIERSALGHTVRTTLEERIGARARSRLFEMCTIVRTWAAGDYRLKPRRAFTP